MTDAEHQQTVARETTVEGVTLFTGAHARVTFRPAEPDHGIVFVRADLPGQPRIPARADAISPADHHTALQHDGARVDTVEHCLAATAGLRIDNVLVEVQGPELPIGDGSCAHFVEALEHAGTKRLDATAREIVVTAPIEVRCDDSGATITAQPTSGTPRYDYHLDYGEGAPIEPHEAGAHCTPEDFRHDLAFARTFSTLRQAEEARAMGLFTHLSPEDILVIGPEGPVNNALHRPDEPARHKVVDMSGDLALVGARLRAHVIGHRSGHALNHARARAILDQNG